MNYFLMIITGIVECFLLSLNTKFLQKNKKLPCFIVSLLSIIIWYYVISTVVENMHNWKLLMCYAIGFSSGDVLAIEFDVYLEKLAKIYGLKFKKKKIRRKK